MSQRKPVSLIVFIFLVSCRVDPEVRAPLPTNDLKEQIPDGWPAPVYRFSGNPLTENTFVLGRALFYETMLSRDNLVSCGSCHQQFAAFANADHRVSHGINSLNGIRNAPGIFNLAWHPLFMHDGGVNHIEVQPLAPLTNPVEMGEEIGEVITRLEGSEKYKGLFKEAFGTEEINSQRMLKAITQFMGLIYSNSSRYDQYKKNEVQFTAQESHGYELFLSKCNGCHREPLFSDFGFRSNGLAADPSVQDSGRARITGDASDLYRFKTPSLRNVALTAPYMHDGRYATLQDCLDHYTDKVTNPVNLDPALQPNGLVIDANEKADLAAFLQTLSDFKLTSDKRFSDPNFK
jgi:cytochrome c peroxidase